MLDASRGPFEWFWGYVEELALETPPPSGQQGRVTIPATAKHFFTKALLLPGTGIAKMPPERAYVGPSWGYIGARLDHLGSMGPCSPILGYVDPPEVIFELCCFHEFTFIPKFCLKAPFLQHHFSEKAESCWDGHTPDERLKAPTSGLRGSRKRFPRVGRGVGGSWPVPH